MKASSQASKPFKLHSPYPPAGDQENVIRSITDSIKKRNREQTILGVTGSGKTFMMASIVQNLQRPTLVIAHNKTLAAQLAEEFKRFFPDNAVHYFVSYYDYYQPESYIPRSDTFIEKQTQINEEIERLRNASTQALLTRKDVLIVASVSCIYGLGNPEDFNALKLIMEVGEDFKLDKVVRRLIDMQFIRTQMDLRRGVFRLRGDTLEVVPASEELGYRFIFFGDTLEEIEAFNLITNVTKEKIKSYTIFPAKQYVTTQEKINNAMVKIQEDMEKQVALFQAENKLLPAERIKQRTQNDLEMLKNLGFVSGIENYSSYFDNRQDGEAPTTLLDYFPADALCFVDESHITLPQIGAMYAGDRSRKTTLVEYGFRLPSALNNRPLKREEFNEKMSQLVYVSATPAIYEIEASSVVAKAIIRPTGLLDPEITIKPVKYQVEDVLEQVRLRVERGQRVLITTLTKKFSEELDIYFKQINIKSAYIHSDVETLDRLDILSDLRRGRYDVLIGINLLREGLDLPEVSLVAIFDADKEGFLRSKTSLTQIVGRAARHEEGKVIMYADTITKSMRGAIEETEARRSLQIAHNLKHGITPKSTTRELKTIADDIREEVEKDEEYGMAGANYSVTGFEEIKIESNFGGGGEGRKNANRMARERRNESKSIHGSKPQERSTQRGRQVFDMFDEQKRQNTLELEKLNLNKTELKERLKIAIDAMDFEMAAAVRDIIGKK
ncbi:MAG: excinuclease ABC subunit UvrB [candidate division SR1 bacterium]|nr:excinuclease ABC subunit UvrB [candidate division SR1 bacterium]